LGSIFYVKVLSKNKELFCYRPKTAAPIAEKKQRIWKNNSNDVHEKKSSKNH
jgi:hypothetical protein